MAKLTITLIILLNSISYAAHDLSLKQNGTQSITLGSEFTNGWELGWKAGWKQVNGQYSYPPYPPFPPFPNFGEDNFQGGYNAGFLAGIEAAEGLR